jgi:hypothetical protein
VTSAPAIPPSAIARGLRGAGGIAACVVEDGPTFHAELKKWVISFSLRRNAGARFIGPTTQWCALIDEDYPFGDIAIHPATEGGITATFAHQSQNTPSKNQQAWRDGKLCLDSPFGGERRLALVRDPVGEPNERLRWHLERAVLWLDRAANDQLLAPGDLFELPARFFTTARPWPQPRVVHDETSRTFDAWRERESTFGFADFGLLADIDNAIAVSCFGDRTNTTIREWGGRQLAKCDDVTGFWWLWPKPIVLPPWQAPSTWGELRRIAKTMGLDSDGVLRWLLELVRGVKTTNVLMLGYPIPVRIGEPITEVHWDALLLPLVGAPVGKPPGGFRPNARGWWQRDRYGTFADNVALEYLHGENWSPDRLQARGRLPNAVCDLRIAVLGLGALGSMLAETLVRAGVRDIALLDGDVVMAGNVCRHTATLVDVGKPKVAVVAQRLRQISPTVRVTEIPEVLHGPTSALVEKFDDCDAIVDCTSSDEALTLLSTAWWSMPRILVSFSLGYAGKRVFSFGVSGHRFPQDEFVKNLRPWLEHEAKMWAASEEVLEGAGCWSPLFPARHDDVMLAAVTCVKEMEALVAKRPLPPRFRVFAQESSNEGFQGFRRESAPPPVEVTASS